MKLVNIARVTLVVQAILFVMVGAYYAVTAWVQLQKPLSCSDCLDLRAIGLIVGGILLAMAVGNIAVAWILGRFKRLGLLLGIAWAGLLIVLFGGSFVDMWLSKQSLDTSIVAAPSYLMVLVLLLVEVVNMWRSKA